MRFSSGLAAAGESRENGDSMTVFMALQREAEVLREQGLPAEARRRCGEILAADPKDLGALNLMAALAADESDPDGVMHWTQRVLALDPRSASAYYTRGRLQQSEGRFADAEASYRHALAIDGENARAHNNLGCVLQMQGRLDEAAASFRRALELDPSLPQAKQNLASIARDRGTLEEAAAGYRRAAAANPADSHVCNDLGNVYRELGMHAEALASFDEAIRRNPGNAQAHFSRSFELLLAGKYEEGFEEFEWRWRVKGLNAPMRSFVQPLWDGRELPGESLLLHAEQGLGDTLFSVRYAAAAAKRCGAVVLECQGELVPLLGSVRGISRVVAQGSALPAFAAHLPLMSLPRVFGTTLQSIPWDGPYVRADAARVEDWRALVAAEAGDARLKVGLVWAGRPQQGDDRKRSIALSMLAPLARSRGVAFYSLQKGPPAAQAAAPPPGMRLADPGARLRDFADTAALISHLDLVITIDTSVAHLSGAMGRPAWVLLSQVPDWRYHLEGEGCRWYPTMRLFRQQKDGEWSDAIARVARELEALAAEN
jgi:tetratricopeptide (TPR) repeat protein